MIVRNHKLLMHTEGAGPMIVDNVRIHSVALSDKEVTEIYA